MFSCISLISFVQILYYQGHAYAIVAPRWLFLLSQATSFLPPSCNDFWRICHWCVPVISVLWDGDYPDPHISLSWMVWFCLHAVCGNSRYPILIFSVSFYYLSWNRRQSICFGVCSCLFFPKHLLKTQCIGSCLSLPLLKLWCIVTVMPLFFPLHGSAQADSQSVFLSCLYPVTSETCFSFLSFFPLLWKKHFPLIFSITGQGFIHPGSLESSSPNLFFALENKPNEWKQVSGRVQIPSEICPSHQPH